MLIRTGLGSISFVAGCCWVNSVVRSAPAAPTGSRSMERGGNTEAVRPLPRRRGSEDQGLGGSSR